MAAPSVRAFVTQTFNNLTSWDVPLPDTIEAGDELLIGLHIRQEGTITVPDGWEIVSDGTTSANVVSSTVSNRQLWLRKTGGAAGDEDSTTVAVGLGADIADGSSHAFAVQGHDTSEPVALVYAVTDEDGGLTYTSPTSIETPRADCLVLHGYAASSNSNNSGFTWSHSTASEITDVRANNRQTMTVASATQASAGAITENVGTADVAGSTVTWGTVVVLVIQSPEDDEPEPVAVTTGAGALSLAVQATSVVLGALSLATGAGALSLAAQATMVTLGALSLTTGAANLALVARAASVDTGADEPDPWRPFTASTSLANPSATASLAPFRQTVSLGGDA